MYLTVGSASNVDAGEDPMRAAIHRYNPDGSGHEVVATGVRNISDSAGIPARKHFGRPCRSATDWETIWCPTISRPIKTGGFYGWPYAYIGPNEDPRRKGEKPDLVKKTIAPDVQLGAHVAVLDTLFYTGKQFPKEYQGGAFLAFHGSWNRSRRVGYSLAFIPFSEGKPQSGPKDFLNGIHAGSGENGKSGGARWDCSSFRTVHC